MSTPTNREIVDAAVAIRRREHTLDEITDPATQAAVRQAARLLTTADMHALAPKRRSRVAAAVPIRRR